MRVAPPPGVTLSRLLTFANGHQVPHSVSNGLVVFDLPTTAGAAANWAVAAAAAPVKLGCSPPTGTIFDTQLGPFALGLTRTRARQILRPFEVTHYGFDNFCLRGGWGIRLGYGSRRLLRGYPPRVRRAFLGRVVLALTANRHYALDGVRPGARVARVARRLHLEKPFHIGLNYWYVAPGALAAAVLKVRHGIVQEVGIAAKALTRGRAAQWRFLTSFRAV